MLQEDDKLTLEKVVQRYRQRELTRVLRICLHRYTRSELRLKIIPHIYRRKHHYKHLIKDNIPNVGVAVVNANKKACSAKDVTRNVCNKVGRFAKHCLSKKKKIQVNPKSHQKLRQNC